MHLLVVIEAVLSLQSRSSGIAVPSAASGSPRSCHDRCTTCRLRYSATGCLPLLSLPAWVLQGTCPKLEKSYFRLTSAPDPSVVRPPTVLRRALDRLLRLLRDGAVQYFYAVDQFKGMRQVLLRPSLGVP